jgi:hypothetical protein
MKFLNRFAVVLIVGVSFVLSGNANAGSDGTRGGGDAVSQDFSRIGWIVLHQLSKGFPEGAPAIDLKLLRSVLETVQIASTDDKLTLDGNPKDAVNDLVANQITINRPRWIALSVRERKQLVLHEYLRFMKMNDFNYRISAPIALALEGLPMAKIESSALDVNLSVRDLLMPWIRFEERGRTCFQLASIVNKLDTVSTAFRSYELSKMASVAMEIRRMEFWKDSLSTYCLHRKIYFDGQIYGASEKNLRLLLMLISRDSEMVIAIITGSDDPMQVWDRFGKQFQQFGDFEK